MTSFSWFKWLKWLTADENSVLLENSSLSKLFQSAKYHYMINYIIYNSSCFNCIVPVISSKRQDTFIDFNWQKSIRNTLNVTKNVRNCISSLDTAYCCQNSKYQQSARTIIILLRQCQISGANFEECPEIDRTVSNCLLVYF